MERTWTVRLKNKNQKWQTEAEKSDAFIAPQMEIEEPQNVASDTCGLRTGEAEETDTTSMVTKDLKIC